MRGNRSRCPMQSGRSGRLDARGRALPDGYRLCLYIGPDGRDLFICTSSGYRPEPGQRKG